MDKKEEAPVLNLHSVARAFAGGLAMGLVVGTVVMVGHKIGNALNGR